MSIYLVAASEVSRIITAMGDGMDVESYVVYLEQSMTKYRVIGSILSVLSGLGLLKNLNK